MILLTAIGAWLAAIPFILFFGAFYKWSADNPILIGIIGLLLIALSMVMLRQCSSRLFVEQLAIPGLIVGVDMLLWMMTRQDFLTLTLTRSFLIICPLLLLISALLPQTWLRGLLGAAAAVAGVIGLSGETFGLQPLPLMSLWLALHGILLAVLVLAVIVLRQPAGGAQARVAAWAESVGSGWLMLTVAGMAWWSGKTFLLSASLPFGSGTFTTIDLEPWRSLGYSNAVSALLTFVGGFWLMRRWPAVRTPWCIGVLLVLAVLAALMPALGACLLVLALCVGTQQRWRLGIAAALAATWIVGAFYYSLSWSLMTKAAVLGAAAMVLAVLALWGFRSLQAKTTANPQETLATDALAGAIQPNQLARLAIALSALLVLVVVNFSIWQKEDLIAHGQSVFVPLQPVDPRSLMQGDYMALEFLPQPLATSAENHPARSTADHPRMVFKRDAQGILSVLGLDQGQALTADQIAIQLVFKNGRWILVTDAFYFKEGEAERWAAARFGEFRVDKNGTALLVGLRGADLKPL